MPLEAPTATADFDTPETDDDKFNADQPRHPAGRQEGGQWSGGVGGSSSMSEGTLGRSPDAQAGHTFIDTATSERVDTTEREGQRIIDRYAPDGTLSSRTVENEDGSRLESEFRTPGDPGDWNERHVLTTAEGRKYWVTNTGDTQRISTGKDGDTLVSTSEWAASGPELRVQPAFAPNPSVLGNLLTLYSGMSGVTPADPPPVIVFKANEYEPGSTLDVAAIWLGSRTRDQVDEACPRNGEVQQRTNDAVQAVTQSANYNGPVDYGTKVHKNLADQIKGLNNPDFQAEVSAIKSREASYGKAGSIRVDVFERVPATETVCVYDIKTGRAGLTVPRSLEIATNVQKLYPGTEKIIVIEVRPQ